MGSVSVPSRLMDARGNVPNFAQTASGFLVPTTPQANCLLYDNFNGGTIDTVNRWQSPVTANGGALTQNGSLVAAAGALASGRASIQSIENFEPSLGGVAGGTILVMEAAPSINTNRIYGFYTLNPAFTALTPVQDGYVWEYDVAGTWGVSIYNGGVQVKRQVFALNVDPLTGNANSFPFMPCDVIYQGLNVDFYYGNFNTPCASVRFTQPSTLNLPFGMHSINHTVAPAAAPTWNMLSAAAVDLSGCVPTVFNGQSISRLRTASVFKNISAAASGATVWTPAAGRKFRLMGYVLALSAAGIVTLTDSTPASTIDGGIIPLGTNPQSSPPQGNGYLSKAVNSTITASISGGGTLSGYLFGTEE